MTDDKSIIAELQCPGCVGGPDPAECPGFKFEELTGGGKRCAGHVPGTSILGPGGAITFSLGMPKGFDRGANGETIRIWNAEDGWPAWDHLNIPVWYRQHDGKVFVRTFMPRLARHWVEVVHNIDVVADLQRDWPACYDVDDFVEDID